MVKLLERVIKKEPKIASDFSEKIFALVSSMISSDKFLLRVEAKEVISTLCRAIGLSRTIVVLRKSLDSQDMQERDTTAQIFSICCHYFSLKNFLPFLRAISTTQKSPLIRNTALRVILYSIRLNSTGIKAHFKELMNLLHGLLKDELASNWILAIKCIQSLVEFCGDCSIDQLDFLMEDIWRSSDSNNGKEAL